MVVNITIVPWTRMGTIWGNAIHHTSQLRWRCTAAGSSHGNGGEVGKMGFSGSKEGSCLFVLFPKSQMFWKGLGYHIVYIYINIYCKHVFWKQIDLSWGISFLCKCCKSHRNKVQEFNAGSYGWNPWILRMELDLRVAGITLMVPWRWKFHKFLVRRFVDVCCENLPCF